MTTLYVSGVDFSNGVLVNNLSVLVRHLPKLQSVSVGSDKFKEDWNAFKYPRSVSLLCALFDQRRLVNILMGGYTPEKDKFLVELLKRYLTDGKPRAYSCLELGCVRDARLGVRLVAELVKGVSQIRCGFGKNFRLLIGEMWCQYLEANQLLKRQPDSLFFFLLKNSATG